MRSSHLPHAQLSLQLVKFSLKSSMRIMAGMLAFTFWEFRAPKFEAVIFATFRSACMYARPLNYSDVPISLRAHVPYSHAHVVHI